MPVQHILFDLLSAGGLEQTITALKTIFNTTNDRNLYNDVTLLSSRYNQIKAEEHRGSTTSGEVRREKAKIAAALMEIIRQVPATATLPDIPSHPKPVATPNRPTNVTTTAAAPSASSKIPLFLGIGAILAAVALIVIITCPSSTQFFVIRLLMALGVAACAYYLPGTLDLDLSTGVKAGGCLGVLALIYLINPASGLVRQDDCITEVPVTVFVHGDGGRQDLVLRQQGHILMDYRGERKRQAISENGEAYFNNLKIGEKIHLNVDFSEPYKASHPDSTYTIDQSGKIYLQVALQNLDKVYGRVLYRDQPLPEVIVSIGSALRDTTDELGNYELSIPPARQRKEQEVSFFKPNFKLMTKKAYPQTNEPMNVVMMK